MDQNLKWHWMMDYCKKQGISPAQEANWKRAEKAWEEGPVKVYSGDLPQVSTDPELWSNEHSQSIPSDKVQQFKLHGVSKPFEWRDKQGNFHKVTEMNTSYLFNTLKMIWNNVVPEDQRIMPCYLYNFGPNYTLEYMIEAIQAIVIELWARSDLNTFQLTALAKMAQTTKLLRLT